MIDLLDARGSRPAGARLTRILASPNYRDGAFQNPVETTMMAAGSMREMLVRQFIGKEERVPKSELPVVRGNAVRYDDPPKSGLRVTWLGHSSVLLEIDGVRILIDPVLSLRASPSESIGPKRFHPAPLTVPNLPRIDVLIITHDHYDHLDMRVIRELVGSPMHAEIEYVTALGVGAHLEAWGVDQTRITELDWGEKTEKNGVAITACPARHFSGRAIKRNQTLWASWVIATQHHRAFHSGDTGFFEAIQSIGDEYGPFDLTMVKMGAYDSLWPDIHLNPEEALRVHAMLRGRVLLPIHWGTFNLAMHSWREPIERLLASAGPANVQVVTPTPGEWLEPDAPAQANFWWATL